MVDLARLQKVADRVHCHGSGILLGLFCRGSQMWDGQHVGLAPQALGKRKVADVAARGAGLVVVGQCIFVDDFAAREVQDGSVLLHLRQQRLADQTLGVLVVRRVQRDVVGLRRHSVDAQHLHLRAREAQSTLHRERRVVPDDLHAQRQRRVRHRRADGPEADQAQRLAHELPAAEHGLVLFDALVRRAFQVQLLHVVNPFDHAPARQK
mmetsp:Transcript_21575/g.73159  ORF Transcript_21575/g.73159 Transcript_21575/m.73159 type:complete len:209 (-) Transcript_21575:460-1086(-)